VALPNRKERQTKRALRYLGNHRFNCLCFRCYS